MSFTVPDIEVVIEVARMSPRRPAQAGILMPNYVSASPNNSPTAVAARAAVRHMTPENRQKMFGPKTLRYG
jgi:hypothetical protein